MARILARRFRGTREGTYGWRIGKPTLLVLWPQHKAIWPEQLEFTLRELGLDPMLLAPAYEGERVLFIQDLTRWPVGTRSLRIVDPQERRSMAESTLLDAGLATTTSR